MPSRAGKKTTEAGKTNHQFTDEKMIIPVIEGEVTIEKHIGPTGKVNATKRIREQEEVIDDPTYRGEVSINKSPHKFVCRRTPADSPGRRYDDNTNRSGTDGDG